MQELSKSWMTLGAKQHHKLTTEKGGLNKLDKAQQTNPSLGRCLQLTPKTERCQLDGSEAISTNTCSSFCAGTSSSTAQQSSETHLDICM